MANQLKYGNEAQLIESRHGETNNVSLNVDISQDLKSELVALATSTNKTLKQVCTEALETYLRGQ